jgi:hypothetical protein
MWARHEYDKSQCWVLPTIHEANALSCTGLRKTQPNTVVKYCSDRCRNRKPGKLDRQIEFTIVRLLNGQGVSSPHVDSIENTSDKPKPVRRQSVSCDEVEEIIFGPSRTGDPASLNDATIASSLTDDYEQLDKDENKTSEAMSQAQKQRHGQQRAEQREMIRRAARRGVIFGFEIEDDGSEHDLPIQTSRRRCEAVVDSKVVEPSFAKGNWAVRWRG